MRSNEKKFQRTIERDPTTGRAELREEQNRKILLGDVSNLQYRILWSILNEGIHGDVLGAVVGRYGIFFKKKTLLSMLNKLRKYNHA